MSMPKKDDGPLATIYADTDALPAPRKKTQPKRIYTRDYKPSKTCAEFHASNAFVRCIIGPVGSGKSTAMIWEIIKRAQEQKPNANGVRSTRWAAIRNTYPDLLGTTIKSWKMWIPEEIAPIRQTVPILAKLKFPMKDGTSVDCEVEFIAMDSPEAVRTLLSRDLTGVWINEGRELPKEVLDMATSRVGRYPAAKDGGPTWHGIVIDSNACASDHWFHRVFVLEKPQVTLPNGPIIRYETFIQPAAMFYNKNDCLQENPDAENIDNLPGGFGYYWQQIPEKTREWIEVYICVKFTSAFSGKAIWPEYKEHVHSRDALEVYRGLPLIIGQDFGLTPHAAICQLSPRGQLRVIDEVCATDVGIRRFANERLIPKIANDYPGMQVRVIGDPAGAAKAQTDEKTCFDILRACGLTAEPAESNLFSARREAVSKYLMLSIDGEPGFLIDRKKCPMGHAAMKGGFCFKRVRVQGRTEVYRDEPDKDSPYSHIGDAIGYAAMATQAKLVVPQRQSLTLPIVEIVDMSPYST